MCLLGTADGLLDGIQGRAGKHHACAPMRRCRMSKQPSDLHYQLPEAPPPLKLPPPPLKPPPPPPPPPPPKPPKPPPPKPPRPPPRPPPQPLPPDHPRELDHASMANKNATTPAPKPMGSKWLNS